ncbi:MAG: SiaB family protein kinase [Bacteroidales bacterium]|nr:SiaB family protein kinase [Bacteroidales bacterium]
MTTKTIFEFYKLLEKDKISFSYRGRFSNNVLTMATELLKENLDEEHGRLRNKLSFLMIESFQNISRYADKENSELDETSEFFMTRNVGDTFYIISANLIDNDKIPVVKEKLEKVNTLDKKELNLLYREVLTNKQINEKGGAGLGFIEMVRKTKGKLPFDFVKIDDKQSMFFMQIELKNAKTDDGLPSLPISDAKFVQEIVATENILMMHKGDFSEEAVGPMIRMVEENMQNISLKIHKKIFHFLVEILQNISKHAYSTDDKREGIFQIGFMNNKFHIGTGNLIANNEIKNLKSQIDSVNSKTKDELNELYRKFLREGKSTKTGSAGLGLIDLARETEDNIKYEFTQINNEYSFFSLTVNF